MLSGGLNIRSTAQSLYPLRREFPVSERDFIVLTPRQLAHSFPNPVPAGTRVPQWALLDVTVRCRVNCFFFPDVLTTHQLENSWNVNKSMAVGGRNTLLFCFTFSTVSCLRL
jgi:hypothetical protein